MIRDAVKPGKARRSQEELGEPGATRRRQGQPGGARGNQEEQRGSQEEPGNA